MMKKYMLLLFLGFLSISLAAQVAQEEEEENVEPEYNFKRTMMLGGYLQFGYPQGPFKRSIDTNAWGFGGNIMGRLGGESPIHLGFDFSVLTFDRERVFEDVFSGSQVDQFQVTTKNKLLNAHLLIRYQPEVDFFIEPYFEGMIGTKVFYTKTEVQDLNSQSSGTLSSDFDRADWAVSIGAAAGIQIPIKGDFFMLDARCAFLKGTSTSYLARRENDTGIYLDPIEAFEEKNSITDMFLPQIGFKVLIGFGNQNNEEYEEEIYEDETEYEE